MISYDEVVNNNNLLNMVKPGEFVPKLEKKEEELDPVAIIMEQNYQNNRLLQQVLNQGAIQMALTTLIAEKCGVDVNELANNLKKKMEGNLDDKKSNKV